MANDPGDFRGTAGGVELKEEDDSLMDMAALLAQEEQSRIHSLRRGEVVEGTIISVGRDFSKPSRLETKKPPQFLAKAFMTPAAAYFPQRLAPPVSSTL